MNRSTMRSVLRRRLNEQTPHNWTDVELDDLLNEALFWVQKKALRVNPLAFLTWTRTTLKKDESFYKRAVGSWWEFEVAVKATAAATTYTPLKRHPYKEIREFESVQEVVGWAKMGTFIAILPAPPEDIVDGLQVIHTPLLTMAVDTDVPDLHLSLHTMVVVKANQLALQERPESPQSAPVMAELKDLDADIVLVYGREAIDSVDRLWIPPEAIGRMDETTFIVPR